MSPAVAVRQASVAAHVVRHRAVARILRARDAAGAEGENG